MGISNWFKRNKNSATPKKTVKRLDDKAARAETQQEYDEALGIPRFPDPLRDEIGEDAYTQIRRTDVTSRPVDKFATQVSAMRLVVQGDHPDDVQFVSDCQGLVDEIPGLSAAIKHLVWALVEGKRYCWLRAGRVRGWAVPVLVDGGRKRVEAGGSIVDYDDKVVKVRTDESGAEEYNRNRWIIFKVGGDDTLDLDLAWMLYQIAFTVQAIDKNLNLFGDRHGLPLTIYNNRVQKQRATAVRSAVKDAAKKMAQLNGRTSQVGQVSDELIKLLEPSGTGSNFLLAHLDKEETRAHSLVLQNVLTSITSGAGPTQSSELHKGEQEIAEESLAGALAECLTAQLLPFMIRHNQEKLGTPKGLIKLVFERAVTRKVSGPTEATSLWATGAPIDADWLYGAHGATKPVEVPDVIQLADYAPQPAAQANPFGFLSVGDAVHPAGLSMTKRLQKALEDEKLEFKDDRLLEELQAYNVGTPQSPFKLNIPEKGPIPRSTRRFMLSGSVTVRNEADFIIGQTNKRLTEQLTAGYWSLVKQWQDGKKMKLDKRLANEIAKTRGLSDLAGRARFDREVGSLKKRVALASSIAVDVEASFDLPMDEAFTDFASRAAVTTETTAEVSAAYRAHRFTVLKSVELTMVEQIQAKILAFKDTGIDRASFSKWLTEQPGDFDKSYANLVSRNAVNAAYSRGRLEQFKTIQNDPDIVGWEWSTVGDSAVRDSHAFLDGKVFPKDNKNKPPKGYNCRCSWFPVESGAKVMSGKEADQLVAKTVKSDPQFAEFNIESDTYGA